MAAAQQPDTNSDPEEGQEKSTFAMDRALAGANLAEQLQKTDLDDLTEIGCDVVEGYRNDEQSRTEWMNRNREYMKLATQVMERKTFPWTDAANVKYPLLTTAALQFAARAYSSLVPSFDIVKAKVIGDDPQGQMTELANKLSTHLSYQILYEIDDWEENMDKLCFILPIVGTMFKKVYYDAKDKKVCCDLLAPKDLVVNYFTKRIKDASRITEIQYYTCNEIKEFQNKGLWLKYDDDFGPGQITLDELNKVTTALSTPAPDEETPRKFLVQYCRLDLDDDDYKEPYIVTVDEESKKVVRIVANFYSSDIEYQDQDNTKVACIHPAECFVKFDFLPNPDGGFYGIGFGILLGGLNDMVNTITNQLIDAGTLANLQAGFIGRGLRDNKQKDMKFRPGEWKWVNNPGKDLKENIFPLPVREPSSTLFQLLGTLVESGKQVASVADIFTGKIPGQNTPASTTMATIEQGLKVFTSIYKRIYRGMSKEFLLLFDLNKKYAPTQEVMAVGQINGVEKSYGVSRFDYQKGSQTVKIMPSADSNMVSETQKLLKLQGLYELMQYGTINAQEMTRQALVYQGQEHIQQLMTMPPPQPPLEIQLKQMDSQDRNKDRQLQMMKIMQDGKLQMSTVALNLAKAKELGNAQDTMMLQAQLDKEQAQVDMIMKWMDIQMQKEQNEQDMAHEQAMHQQDMAAAASELRINQIKGSQDLAFNAQKNDKTLELMDSKHKMQMSQAKEKASMKGSNAK